MKKQTRAEIDAEMATVARLREEQVDILCRALMAIDSYNDRMDVLLDRRARA